MLRRYAIFKLDDDITVQGLVVIEENTFYLVKPKNEKYALILSKLPDRSVMKEDDIKEKLLGMGTTELSVKIRNILLPMNRNSRVVVSRWTNEEPQECSICMDRIANQCAPECKCKYPPICHKCRVERCPICRSDVVHWMFIDYIQPSLSLPIVDAKKEKFWTIGKRKCYCNRKTPCKECQKSLDCKRGLRKTLGRTCVDYCQ